MHKVTTGRYRNNWICNNQEACEAREIAAAAEPRERKRRRMHEAVL